MVWTETLAAIQYGYYISAWKVLPVLVVLLLWGRLLTWIDKDTGPILLPRVPINIGMLLGGILAFGLFFVLPGFTIAISVLCGIVALEAGVYLFVRHQKAGLGDLKKQFNEWVTSWTSKEKKIKEIAGEVQLIGKNNALVAAPDAESPDRAPYEAIQSVLAEPLRRNAERIDLAPANGAAAVKYLVDGVAYNGTQLDLARAASAIEFIKRTAGLVLEEKRKPQTGQMKVNIDGKKRELQVQTAGSSSGEQLRVMVDVKKRHDLKLEDMGLSQKQIDLIKESINDNTGIVLVSAPKQQGLTSTLYGILRAHDAFLTHIHTIETGSDTDLEGITQNKLPPTATPAEELKLINWVSSQEPEALMVSQISDSKSAQSLAKFATTDRRVYIGMRAGSTFDTLNLWRKLIGDDKVAMKDLKMIINSRVVRRLCAACKVGYTPDPGTLRKLNMDPDKISKLYQARTQPIRDPKGNPIPCEFCKELHFKGRIGVYEILIIDDEIRAHMEGGGSSSQLKALFRKQRGKYLQEQALAQVEAGETSVQEVLRVMKPPESSGGSSSSRSSSKPPTKPTA